MRERPVFALLTCTVHAVYLVSSATGMKHDSCKRHVQINMMYDDWEISGHDIVSYTDGSICPLPFLEPWFACSNKLIWSFAHTIYIILIPTAVLLSCKCAALQLMDVSDVLFPGAPSIMTLLNLDSRNRDIKLD